ncbi:hypothetical protein MM5_150 [Morganella phage vB_Mm5]
MNNNRLENFRSRAYTRTSPTTVESFKYHLMNGHINLNPDYQREYVWGYQEQQSFFNSLIHGLPVGTIAIAEYDTDSEMFMEAVDGKQRLTTLQLLFNDEIPICIDGVEYFWSNFSVVSQRFFRGLHLPTELLLDTSRKTILEYFYNVNFSGVPQSDEHKQHIINMMENKNG